MSLICVTGPIAVGKSSLVGPLAERLGAIAYPEENALNPFYEALLENPSRLAFEAELLFVILSLEKWFLARSSGRLAVLERCPSDNVEVFGSSRLAHGHISKDQQGLLERCVSLASLADVTPDLVVWLHAPASVMTDRVRLRNAPGEESYTEPYLCEIGERYTQWAEKSCLAPILRVDTSVDDVRSPTVIDRIAIEVQKALPASFAFDGSE